ncbi:hypothetical protein C1A50_1751 [Paenibacillus polymyxa]|nr:hypothetical protein C1A50_1751 [Paenibacillus polymyxa]
MYITYKEVRHIKKTEIDISDIKHNMEVKKEYKIHKKEIYNDSKIVYV